MPTALRSLSAIALALAGCDDDPPIAETTIDRIEEHLERWNCDLDRDDVEYADGGFDVEADCPDGEFDIVVNGEFEVISMEVD